jgi:hypothetical protein
VLSKGVTTAADGVVAAEPVVGGTEPFVGRAELIVGAVDSVVGGAEEGAAWVDGTVVAPVCDPLALPDDAQAAIATAMSAAPTGALHLELVKCPPVRPTAPS